MPEGVARVKDRAVDIDPDAQSVGLAGGGRVGDDFQVVFPGIALDWDRLLGVADTLGRDGCRATTSPS